MAEKLTALHYCVENGNYKISKLLIDKGANINIADFFGLNVLHYCARDGKIEVLKLLLDHGADIGAKDGKGHTALWFSSGYSEISMLLVERGADIYELEHERDRSFVSRKLAEKESPNGKSHDVESQDDVKQTAKKPRDTSDS